MQPKRENANAVNTGNGAVSPISPPPTKPSANAANAANAATNAIKNQLIGKWTGKPINRFMQFIDIQFFENGMVQMGNEALRWDIAISNNQKMIKMYNGKNIPQSEYNKIATGADGMQVVSQSELIFLVNGKNQRILKDGNSYFLVQRTEDFVIQILNERTLELRINQNGETVLAKYLK